MRGRGIPSVVLGAMLTLLALSMNSCCFDTASIAVKVTAVAAPVLFVIFTMTFFKILKPFAGAASLDKKIMSL